MAAAPMKFTFDLDLERRRERSAVVSESSMSSMLADARDEGFRQGRQQGERSAAAEAGRRIAVAVEALTERIVTTAAELDTARQQNLADAVGLAATIARKLAGALIAREPAVEVEALIADCLVSLDAVPHLVIRCAPDLAETIRDIATDRVAHSGFSGRLVVLGDPEVALGDARIEWADGGVVRNLDQLASEVDARIAEFLTVRRTRSGATEETAR